VLAQDKLAGRKIGVLALGGLPGGVSNDIEAALEPTGAKLVAVGVIREPPDLSSLSGDLSNTRFADLATNPDTVQALGTGMGRQLVIGGNLLQKAGSNLFSRVSGQFGNLDGLVVVRAQPAPLNNAEAESTTRLENGLLDGVGRTAVNAVGVEASDADPSSISFFDEHNLSTVDDIDLTSGKVATVFSLLGAEGNFGIKGSADRLLPDLLTPGPVIPAQVPGGPRKGSRGAAAVGPGRAAGQGK
jgi:Copper transport outer membrane protein, MctB